MYAILYTGNKLRHSMDWRLLHMQTRPALGRSQPQRPRAAPVSLKMESFFCSSGSAPGIMLTAVAGEALQVWHFKMSFEWVVNIGT